MNNSEGVTIVETSIPQDEADILIKTPKIRSDDVIYYFPSAGEKLNIPLISMDSRHNFILDIQRSNMGIMKVTYQNRYRQVIPLIRIDFNGKPHRNPDHQEIPCTHIHYYRAGFDDKWAYPLPEDTFTNHDDYWQVLEDFYKVCTIEIPPHIQPGLS